MVKRLGREAAEADLEGEVYVLVELSGWEWGSKTGRDGGGWTSGCDGSGWRVVLLGRAAGVCVGVCRGGERGVRVRNG